MAAVLEPSVNVFALLERDDPGDTRLADIAAQAAKGDAAAKRRQRRKAYRRQQEPQMSQWKKNKLKAKAEAAAKMKLQQKVAAYTNTNTAGRSRRPQPPAALSRAPPVMTGANVPENRKPPQPAAPSRAQVSTAGANAAMNMKPKPPAAASKAHVDTTANAGDDEQFEQQPPAAPARGNLFDQLFAYANSVRAFMYGNRKQNGPANAKSAVASDAPTDDKNGGRRLA